MFVLRLQNVNETDSFARDNATKNVHLSSSGCLLKFQKAELEKMVYSLLDPLIFFVYDDPIDFTKKEDRATHMVACFGPEFPEEIFVMNGLSVVKRSSKKFEEILF